MVKWLIVFLAATMLSCKNSEKNSKAIKSSESTEAVSSIKDNELKTVQFFVRQINPYCGGAAPTEEMERNRMKGAPAIDFIFYIENKHGVSQRLATNNLGIASAKLKNGSYCIKEGYKADAEMQQSLKNSNWEFDMECLKKWNTTCNLEFEVTDTTNETITFTHYPRCSYEGPVPCITNTGFPPP